MSNDNPFNILGSDKVPQEGATAVTETSAASDLNERIKALIGSSDIFLFMKGNAAMPQCGFSANSIAILDALNVKYNTFDILSDMDIRQGVKEFSNWPTYPQLYFKGQLVGGNDIITEMYHSGDLAQVLGA
ncbi:Grx4 family monothiol glutaredoxin [Halobacteriovorax sp. JY17]|uniref:Grx4 family monothiol glutaredoxin n=1 Tax=Halobacteriovorax sp. JY17 TaxID=2014617 RepID=UPI0025BACE5B|nr:Grx4 family monothiol glutaredoxin [Halobacteriovorax sp. JY17]